VAPARSAVRAMRLLPQPEEAPAKADDSEAKAPETAEEKADGEKPGPSKRPADGPRIPKALRAALEGKAYTPAIETLTETTALRYSDLDPKALKLLDILQEKGKAEEACKFLQQTLSGIPRDQIGNWRAYVYTLVRGLDAEAYAIMKDAGSAEKQAKEARKEKPAPEATEKKKDRDKYTVTRTPLKASAAAFVPGKPVHRTVVGDTAAEAPAALAAEAPAEVPPEAQAQAPAADPLAEAVLHELTS